MMCLLALSIAWQWKQIIAWKWFYVVRPYGNSQSSKKKKFSCLYKIITDNARHDTAAVQMVTCMLMSFKYPFPSGKSNAAEVHRFTAIDNENRLLRCLDKYNYFSNLQEYWYILRPRCYCSLLPFFHFPLSSRLD